MKKISNCSKGNCASCREQLGMNTQNSVTNAVGQNGSILAMLESLADALEDQSEIILDSGETESQELRAQILQDIAEAVRTKFAL